MDFQLRLGGWVLKSQMDTKDITDEQMNKIEEEANSKIRAAVPVSVDVVELDDPKLQKARGRNLPEDVKGQIRIVTMTDVESNVCCGTHVTNLSQLQVIKLLHVVKKKGKCLLHFLSGGRVTERFAQQFRREQQLMSILKTNPSELPQAAEKINVALKTSRKSCQVLSKDLAALEAKTFSENGNVSKFWAYHRDNVDLDFANALLRELGKDIVNNGVLLITVKTEDTSGHMMLVGGNLEKEKLSSLGDSLCEILDGKGNVRGNVYQAKVNKITNVKKAVKLAKEFTDAL
ncbi:Alanyl-tRNA editing protein Aarsd1-B [Orchesella cincta]|uniref:Alanyl-tRNA editing protein Aarsd1-B n=1 Tax=Orchesella cincta TaxID=48709 RepID=A0A1D2NEY0_ORCCI|nr:Alanyl-tRNA editing protein Aarsd1-B [Orchesella cincta]